MEATARPMTEAILREDETCWRKVRCDRVSFIVDAADYFAAAKEAILKAERCIYLIGWEFDLKIRLRPDVAEPEVPDQLRQFLQYVVRERPDLEIFILQWRGAMLLNLARQFGSYLLLKATSKPQIHFRLDGQHPAGACHHQKIVVIDDILAFCGGIDMTLGRWDTQSHLENDARRTEDGGQPMPWHDMTLALDGDAARALGELARWRWKNATGHQLPVPSGSGSIWPDSLTPDLRGVLAGIARTSPGYGDAPEIREIEHLWCDAIRSAGKTIYIENQFLSSGRIANELKAQLERAGGPEIVIVLPYSAESWLESEAMDTRRSLILNDLRSADAEGRLGVYHPVNDEGRPIYVHAKLLIVDDRFVRIGSSNMASRSLGLDTECDLAMEASDQPELGPFLIDLRARMLVEHLGVSPSAISERIQHYDGSVLQAIESLRSNEGRTLVRLPARHLGDTEKALAESRLLDPEEPVDLSTRVADFAKKGLRRIPATVATIGLATAILGVGFMMRRR